MEPTEDRSRRDSGARWERKVSEAEARIQKELTEIVEYLDREVVPNVRRHSSKALRTVADKLQNLAAYMDEHTREKP
ncbi:MAG: hypothetical protein JO187_09555 [Acidobacteria bacterium]|nr:hypothetical protein [Acidobacteriaceae bacterium]MBV9609791.1 hypothetical protein [Acidobacteriota bacterium]